MPPFCQVRDLTQQAQSSLKFKMANNWAVNSFQDNRHVNQWRVRGQLLAGPWGVCSEHAQFNTEAVVMSKQRGL